jgi:hypothetical protein
MKAALEYSHFGVYVAMFNRFGAYVESRFFAYPIGPQGPMESESIKKLAQAFAVTINKS